MLLMCCETRIFTLQSLGQNIKRNSGQVTTQDLISKVEIRYRHDQKIYVWLRPIGLNFTMSADRHLIGR